VEELFKELVRAVLAKYGAFAALFVLFLFWYDYRVTRLWSARLADKDKEIDRIAKERDRLQEVILTRRLSSEEKRIR
jgi:hypothetical protein